jgi:hypothetical protein
VPLYNIVEGRARESHLYAVTSPLRGFGSRKAPIFKNLTGVALPPSPKELGFRAENNMKDFVAYIIKNLLDLPDAVDVNIIEGEQGTVVEVKVSPQDVGKIVGRQGRTIKALRTIAMTVGARVGRRVRLEVIQ